MKLEARKRPRTHTHTHDHHQRQMRAAAQAAAQGTIMPHSGWRCTGRLISSGPGLLACENGMFECRGRCWSVRRAAPPPRQLHAGALVPAALGVHMPSPCIFAWHLAAAIAGLSCCHRLCRPMQCILGGDVGLVPSPGPDDPDPDPGAAGHATRHLQFTVQDCSLQPVQRARSDSAAQARFHPMAPVPRLGAGCSFPCECCVGERCGAARRCSGEEDS